MAPNRLPAVGAFVVGGLLLFAVGLYMIGNRRMMFTDSFEVYAEYSRISGLQNGAIVRVAGLDAGEVESIHLPTSPSARFRVKLRVREDVHPLVRLDSVATIQTDGLVGSKFIQVAAGTDASPQVPPRGTIGSQEPFDFADMMTKVNDTIDMVTVMVKDVKVGIDEALAAVSSTATDAQALIKDTGNEIRAITASGQKVAADLQLVMSRIRQGEGTIGKFVTDDAFYDRARNIATEAERAMVDLREAARTAREAIADFRGNDGPMKGIAGDLQQSLVSAREVLTDLADNTEALKRNFLFRGFFNRRGFFDLDDVSVADYRQGALETGNRQVLRIWAHADVLFEKLPDGTERLTDDGRGRLDSAMGTFVRYPRNTPIVVEGYAGSGTTDVQFRLSRHRAQQVRDYIAGRFGLQPQFLAVMPLGADALGSPSNDRWDGVALAAFVEKRQ